ncbi:MAG: hypothetical protein PHV06_00140 [bacterium]|nr:hypothetical protein [bacterium]
MKKMFFVLAVVFSLVLSFSVFAEEPETDPLFGECEAPLGLGPMGPGPMSDNPGDMEHCKDGPMDKEHCKEGPRRDPMQKLKEELNLSDEQIEKIRDQKDDLNWELQKINLDIKQKNIELARLILDDNISDSKISQKFKEISGLEYSVKEKIYENYKETLNVMNEEQRTKFKKEFNERTCKNEERCKDGNNEKMKNQKHSKGPFMKNKGENIPEEKKEEFKAKAKEKFMDRHGITEEQVKKIEGLKEANAKENHKIHEQIRGKRIELSKLMTQEKLSDNDVKKKMKEISDLELKLRENSYSNFKEELKILNKDQYRGAKIMYAMRLSSPRMGNNGRTMRK